MPRRSDPFAKVGKEQVSVEIASVIRASPDSFRVAWVERRYENGSLGATERWTAILTTVLQTPHDAEKLRRNPLGIYVTGHQLVERNSDDDVAHPHRRKAGALLLAGFTLASCSTYRPPEIAYDDPAATRAVQLAEPLKPVVVVSAAAAIAFARPAQAAAWPTPCGAAPKLPIRS